MGIFNREAECYHVCDNYKPVEDAKEVKKVKYLAIMEDGYHTFVDKMYTDEDLLKHSVKNTGYTYYVVTGEVIPKPHITGVISDK